MSDIDDEAETCPKCEAHMIPMMAIETVPAMSMRLDDEDPDYSSDDPYFDADGEVSMGFRVCRNCQAMLSFWIESATATFMPGWGERRPDQSQAAPANDTTERSLEAIHFLRRKAMNAPYTTRSEIDEAHAAAYYALERQRELEKYVSPCPVCGERIGHAEGCRQGQPESVRQRVPEMADVLAWADGVTGALGTEHADRVTDQEARVAEAVLAAAPEPDDEPDRIVERSEGMGPWGND